jgi:GNAT superfamily N-acetyltransferase
MHREAIDLRPATLEDAPGVATVLHRCFCTFRAFAHAGWEPPTVAWQTADFAHRLRGVAVRTRVAVTPDLGQVVAICGWMPARVDAEPDDPGLGLPEPRGDTEAERRGDVDADAREPIPGLAHLWLLFVVPEHWGTGLASDLLAWAHAGMVEAAYDAARLWTPMGQARARAFYVGRGWEPTAREHLNNDLGLPLVEYRVELG